MITFAQYIEIIKDSVASQGYDQFFPSLCDGRSGVHLNVLECELSNNGEEALAKDWAASVLKSSPWVYLAYRVGGRHVDVCEIRGLEVIKKVRITVK